MAVGRGAGRRAGLVAAAATAGALAAFSWRLDGSPAAPFAAVGRRLLDVPAREGPGLALAAAIGLVAHVALVVAWGVLFARLFGRRRGAALAATAAAFAALVWLAGRLPLPDLLRLGHAARVHPLQLAFVHVVLALGLAVGTRLARVDVGDA